MWIDYDYCGEGDAEPALVWLCPFVVPFGLDLNCAAWPRCQRPDYRGNSCADLAEEELARIEAKGGQPHTL